MNLFWLLIVLLALGGAQSFVFSRFNFKSLKYTRTFSKRSVYEGETVEMVEQIVNRKLLPVPWLRVESRISPDLRFQTAQEEREISEDEQYHKSVFYLGPYSRVTRRQRLSACTAAIISSKPWRPPRAIWSTWGAPPNRWT